MEINRSYQKLVVFILMLASSTFAQDYISKVIPGYGSFDSPKWETVKIDTLENHYEVKFSDATFIIQPNKIGNIKTLFNPTIKLFFKNGIYKEFEAKGYSIQDIKTFDIDRNGFTDLFIEFHAGPTGRNSSIIQTSCFFFENDTLLNFHDISSFYGGINLFKDYNSDNKFEFACIKWCRILAEEPIECDVVNLFEIINGNFSNINSRATNFPLYRCNIINDKFTLDFPTVWSK